MKKMAYILFTTTLMTAGCQTTSFSNPPKFSSSKKSINSGSTQRNNNSLYQEPFELEGKRVNKYTIVREPMSWAEVSNKIYENDHEESIAFLKRINFNRVPEVGDVIYFDDIRMKHMEKPFDGFSYYPISEQEKIEAQAKLEKMIGTVSLTEPKRQIASVPVPVKVLPKKRKPTSGWWNLKALVRQPFYDVKQGDTLWSLSRRFYGNPYGYESILRLNPDVIKPELLRAGSVIKMYPDGFLDSL